MESAYDCLAFPPDDWLRAQMKQDNLGLARAKFATEAVATMIDPPRAEASTARNSTHPLDVLVNLEPVLCGQTLDKMMHSSRLPAGDVHDPIQLVCTEWLGQVKLMQSVMTQRMEERERMFNAGDSAREEQLMLTIEHTGRVIASHATDGGVDWPFVLQLQMTHVSPFPTHTSFSE